MKNSMKKITALLLALVLAASMSATAFAEDYTNQTGNMSGTTNLNYTVTHENTYTELSAVKLNWTVPVVKYVDTTVTTWNTDTLKWTTSQKISTEDNGVTFTLANYGTYAVKASVSFTPDVADSASVSFVKNEVDTNNPTLASIVNDDHSLKVTKGDMTDDAYATAKTKYIADNCTKTISGTVTLTPANLSADSGRLGVYTVSIRNTVHTVTVSYLKNAADEEQTVETITVDDNTEISVTGNVLKIGTNEYTTAAATAEAVDFSGWYSAPLQPLDVNTVTADMNITAAYWAS